jgi:hypothetical protein
MGIKESRIKIETAAKRWVRTREKKIVHDGFPMKQM